MEWRKHRGARACLKVQGHRDAVCTRRRVRSPLPLPALPSSNAPPPPSSSTGRFLLRLRRAARHLRRARRPHGLRVDVPAPRGHPNRPLHQACLRACRCHCRRCPQAAALRPLLVLMALAPPGACSRGCCDCCCLLRASPLLSPALPSARGLRDCTGGSRPRGRDDAPRGAAADVARHHRRHGVGGCPRAGRLGVVRSTMGGEGRSHPQACSAPLRRFGRPAKAPPGHAPAPLRRVWELAHRCLGYSLPILAVANVFLGMQARPVGGGETVGAAFVQARPVGGGETVGAAFVRLGGALRRDCAPT